MTAAHPGSCSSKDEFAGWGNRYRPDLRAFFILDDHSIGAIADDMITMEGKCIEADLFFKQYRVSLLKYEKWRNGALIKTELQRFAVRWYGVEEFKYILEGAGFSDVTVCADFADGNKPSNGNQKFAYQAIKR